MSNSRELRKARREAEFAVWLLARIEALPRRVGQCVKWRNGVIWTRAGDDDWRPHTSPNDTHPSAHVAQYEWELVRPTERSSR